MLTDLGFPAPVRGYGDLSRVLAEGREGRSLPPAGSRGRGPQPPLAPPGSSREW